MKDPYLGIPNSKLAQLKPLDGPLTAELWAVKLPYYGRRMDFSDTSAKLIFIDYYLGPTPGPRSYWLAKSYGKGHMMLIQHEEYKPLIILMSLIARSSESKVGGVVDESEIDRRYVFFNCKG